MSRKFPILAVLALVLTAGAAHAGTFWVGGKVGAAVPLGDMGDVSKAGFCAGVTGDYGVSEMWSVGADAIYNGFGEESASFTDPTLGTFTADSKISAIEIVGNVKLFPPMTGNAHPYLQGGLGLYNMTFKAEGTVGGLSFEGETSESDFGFNFGGGVDFAAGETVKLGIAGAYHYVLTEDEASTYVSVGLRALFGYGP